MREELENKHFDHPNWEAEREDDELFEHFRFEVDPGQSPLRIDKFLQDKIQNATRSKIQDAIKNDYVKVNDASIKPNYKVRPEDVIVMSLPTPPRSDVVVPEDIPINIVHEDDHLLVVNKPAGMVVHPAHSNWTGTLVNALAFHFENLPHDEGGEIRPGLVHRIDKDTSGLLLIAKDEEARAALAKQFFHHTVERTYYALVWGDVKEDKGTITGHIGRSLKDRRVMSIFPDGEFGKPAITHYKVLERFTFVTLVQCNLETGRTHQIRAHMKYLGHPLFNDSTYGGDKILAGNSFSKYKQFVENAFSLLPRQALHAKTLGFEHPVSGKKLQFDSELPEDMLACIDKWRQYTKNIE